MDLQNQYLKRQKKKQNQKGLGYNTRSRNSIKGNSNLRAGWFCAMWGKPKSAYVNNKFISDTIIIKKFN